MPLFPYPVFADTYITTSNIVGCHVSYQNTNGSNVENEITCNLDANYEGYAQFTFSYRVGSQTTNTTAVRYASVSGKQFKVEITTDSQSINTSYTVSVSSISNNHMILSENQDEQIVYSTFPIESYNIQSFCLQNLQYIGMIDDSKYTYGIFNVSTNDELYRSYDVADREYYWIFVMDRNMYNLDVLQNHITFTNCTPTEWNFTTRYLYNGAYTYLFKIKIKIDATGQFAFLARTLTNGAFYMPIACIRTDNKYVSTDFALTYGLSNQLLDDLHIIAQGTQSSSSSSNDLEDSADDIVQNSSTMFTFENQQNTNMNNALQSINTNFDIGTIGSSFLTSAAWVKTQFDNLTNTTPFGSVLSFSLLLGLALLIIGKVYK